eukprot:3257328-Amphidinium_carterae.1
MSCGRNSQLYMWTSRLPEEVLPRPKKVAAATFGPTTVELMKYVQEKASGGDPWATTLLKTCIGELEAGSVSTHSGEDEALEGADAQDVDMDDKPWPHATLFALTTPWKGPTQCSSLHDLTDVEDVPNAIAIVRRLSYRCAIVYPQLLMDLWPDYKVEAITPVARILRFPHLEKRVRTLPILVCRREALLFTIFSSELGSVDPAVHFVPCPKERARQSVGGTRCPAQHHG